jgi:lysophospholipase L1-like esterase
MLSLKKAVSRGETIAMKDLYLLAAGLLTGLAIPASALPQMSNPEPEPSAQLSDTKDNSQPTVSKTTVPDSDGTQEPEFSKPVSSLNPNFKALIRKPLSGTQLYYQRLAALEAGKIYTRLPDERLQSLWISARKSQLSYEDWKKLLTLEGKAMAEGQGVNHLSVLVGDSLSMWFPKEKLPIGKLWLNQGISGDTSTGVLKRLSAFSETKPDVIYVMAGINDLRRGITDETILHNHRLIIRRLHQSHPRSIIIVQSILPTRISTISNNRIRHINRQLGAITKQEGANYLNIHGWFADFEGNLRPELTTDGLHLSQDGYEVWQAALKQVEFKVSLSRIGQEQSVKNQ